MILIVSSPNDAHANAIVKELDKFQANYFLLDTSNFPINYSLTINYEQNKKERGLKFHQRGKDILDVSKVKAIWWRRPQPLKIHEDITRQSHRSFALSESHEAIFGLWHSLDVNWVNCPSKDDLAHRKVYQLKIAEELGLPIPKTCITNNPACASLFLNQLGEKRAICKAFSATWEEWRETRIVKEQEKNLIANVKYAPVIFQEYIEAEYDIRITIVGDKIFPAAIYSRETKYEVDMRMDIGNARIEAVEIPQYVQKGLLSLMKKLGLIYGAIDMRLTPEGRYVFLEINPAGQWLFIEEKTNQPISEALANYLRASVPQK